MYIGYMEANNFKRFRIAYVSEDSIGYWYGDTNYWIRFNSKSKLSILLYEKSNRVTLDREAPDGWLIWGRSVSIDIEKEISGLPDGLQNFILFNIDSLAEFKEIK